MITNWGGHRVSGGKARNRRDRGSWVVAGLVGAVAILSALCVFLGEVAQRPWVALGVPKRVGYWLLGTPLARFASALRFLLMYVPDLALVGVSAAIVACVARRRWYVWIAALLLCYGTVFAYRGGAPWVYLCRSVRDGYFAQALMFLSFTGVFVVVPVLLAVASRKIFVSPSNIRPGHCSKCGYDLRGLPEPRCPECGRDFPAEVLSRSKHGNAKKEDKE